jgi:DNA polymerase-3 subunit delta'
MVCYLVRAAFKAKGNAAAIQDLILWSEKIAGLGRETQKKFLPVSKCSVRR